MDRPDWDEYFMGIAFMAAKRGSCVVENGGAVIVKDRNSLATGYSGSPAGTAICIDLGCSVEQIKPGAKEKILNCRGVHAEQNAILQAAKHGVNIDGATLYCTTAPCPICAKMIINSGIKRLVYINGGLEKRASDFFKEAKVEVEQFRRKALHPRAHELESTT